MAATSSFVAFITLTSSKWYLGKTATLVFKQHYRKALTWVKSGTDGPQVSGCKLSLMSPSSPSNNSQPGRYQFKTSPQVILYWNNDGGLCCGPFFNVVSNKTVLQDIMLMVEDALKDYIAAELQLSGPFQNLWCEFIIYTSKCINIKFRCKNTGIPLFVTISS